jgi:perosamine synthetase
MKTNQNRKIAIAEISLTEAEIEAALGVLRSGFLRQGKHCADFEKEFAEKVGANYAVTSANGSAALHLAYMAFLEPGQEVLVPSMTFIATASMVTAAGGVPVFCDVEEDTFLIDLKDAEKKITEKTRAISPVHLFGNACDIEAIQNFAKKHDLIIVWDAAQAHGATYQDSDVGSFDDFVCYSFYPSKNMFVGEGGITTTNNEEYEYKMRYMRTHGQTDKYYHTLMGLNYRMTDVEAVIGREQLKRLDEMLVIRRRNGTMLHERLADVPGLSVQKITPGSEHAWHQYGVVLDPDVIGKEKEEVRSDLKEKGIGTGVAYPRGLHQQPIFEDMYGIISLPVTEYLCENIINLPVHHGMSEDDVKYVIQTVQEVLI